MATAAAGAVAQDVWLSFSSKQQSRHCNNDYHAARFGSSSSGVLGTGLRIPMGSKKRASHRSLIAVRKSPVRCLAGEPRPKSSSPSAQGNGQSSLVPPLYPNPQRMLVGFSPVYCDKVGQYHCPLLGQDPQGSDRLKIKDFWGVPKMLISSNWRRPCFLVIVPELLMLGFKRLLMSSWVS